MDIFRSNAANHNRGGWSGVDTIYSMDQEPPLPTVRSLLHGVVGRRIEKEGQVKIKAVFCARPFWLFFPILQRWFTAIQSALVHICYVILLLVISMYREKISDKEALKERISEERQSKPQQLLSLKKKIPNSVITRNSPQRDSNEQSLLSVLIFVQNLFPIPL